MKAQLIRLADKLVVAPWVGLLGRWRAAARREQPLPNPGEARVIVVMKLVGMGDAVLMLPCLAAARRQPNCRLIVITSGRCAGVFLAPGVADEVIVMGRRHLGAILRRLWRALRSATDVLDFEQHVYWSTAVALLAPRSARCFGFVSASRWRNRVYAHRVDPGALPRPMKEIFDDLGHSAGLDPAPGLCPLPVRPAARAAAEAWMRGQSLQPGRFLVIAPGSGGTVPFRRMSPLQWAETALAMPAWLPLVLTGAPREGRLLEAIAQQVRQDPERRVAVYVGLDLEQLATLLSAAWKVAATDSGPMHLAAAMGCAVVGIFGPDTPARYRPWNELSRSVWLGLPCSPCNNCWVYREARCIHPQRYSCIRGITGAQVAEALGSPPAAARSSHAG